MEEPAVEPALELANTVIGCPDPPALAEFYRSLLGWVYRDEDHAGDATWVVIKPPGKVGVGLSFQLEEAYAAPVWPAQDGDQQMQLHLDIAAGADLDAAVSRAEALGARPAATQPQELVRVMLDPAGHPFCLFAPGG